MKNRRIFLSKEDYESLERSAQDKGLSVQELVDAAVANVRGVKSR